MKLALVTFFYTITLVYAADVPITQDELVRRTQELYDAVVPGNQAPWKKYFADDCIFADEKGRVFDKPKLVGDITPLPSGYSGTIKIENAQSRIIGNTAILLNDIDLVAEVGGREVTNPFMVTEVYVKENGKWKMGSLTFSHLMRPVKLK